VEAIFPRVAEIPFDSERKLMSTIHKVPDAAGVTKKEAVLFGSPTPFVAFVKGAPEELLKSCTRILVRGFVAPMEAAMPMQMVETSGLIYCMVS